MSSAKFNYPHGKHLRLLYCLVCLIAFETGPKASADTISWTGPGTFWGTDGNWSGDIEPTKFDDLLFDDTAQGFVVDVGNFDRVTSNITIDSLNAYTFQDTGNDNTLQINGDFDVISGTGHEMSVGLFFRFDTLHDIAAGADLTLSGPLTGTGNYTKVGAGTVIFAGANTHTGGTTITEGTLQLGDNGTAGFVVGDILNNATLVLHRSDDFILSGVISGTGDVIKRGAGSVTLEAGNTYTGTTTIEGGILQIADGNTTALANTAVTVETGATLNFADALAGIYQIGSLAGGGNVTASDPNGEAELVVGLDNTSTTFAGSIVLANRPNVNKAGSGTWTLTGDGHSFGDFEVDAGSVVLDGFGGDIGPLENFGGSVTIRNTGTSLEPLSYVNLGSLLITGTGTQVTLNEGNNQGPMTVEDGAVVTNNRFAQINSGILTIDQARFTAESFDPSAFNQRGTIAISDPAGGGSALTVGGDAGGVVSSSSTFQGNIEDHTSGPGSVTKIGSNTIILAGSNTYTGTTTIEAGTLELGNGGTTGSVAGEIVNNATLILNQSTDWTISHAISGTGDLIKRGSNAVTLNAANTYTGTTTIEAGQITLGNALALQNSTVDVANDFGLCAKFGVLQRICSWQVAESPIYHETSLSKEGGSD